MTTDEVHFQQREPQPTLSIRATIPTAQLQQAQDERMKALSAYVKKHRITLVGPPFVRYHTFSKSETDMEVGVPVSEPASGEGEIVSGELPGGPTISTVHVGPHDQLGKAYARLGQWQQENARSANGPGWEIYEWIDLLGYDPGNWPPASEWRAQLVQPVQEDSS